MSLRQSKCVLKKWLSSLPKRKALQVYKDGFRQRSHFIKNTKKTTQSCAPKTFCFASLKGSVTIEAVLVSTLIISVFLMFYNMFFLIQLDSNIQHNLDNIARRYSHSGEQIQSVYGLRWEMEKLVPKRVRMGQWYFGKSNLVGENGQMDVRVYYECNLFPGALGHYSVYCANRVLIHLWNGKDMAGETELVYVTLHGAVYHTDENCTYLKPEVTEVKAEMIEEKHNANGASYTACRRCEEETEGSVYFITKYGTKYHWSRTCPAIYHSVLAIDKKNVGERTLCTKCGQK